jgi:hypothetical protein
MSPLPAEDLLHELAKRSVYLTLPSLPTHVARGNLHHELRMKRSTVADALRGCYHSVQPASHVFFHTLQGAVHIE